MEKMTGRQGLEPSRGLRASRGVRTSVSLFARELLTLAGTDLDPFGCRVVTQTAVIQLEELLLLIVQSEGSLESLERAPLWQSACWVAGTVAQRLERHAGDPAADPVLAAARKAGRLLI